MGNIVFPNKESEVINLPVFSDPDGVWDRLDSVLPATYKRHATLQSFKYMTDEEIEEHANHAALEEYGVAVEDIDFAMYWHQDPGAESNINASFSLYLNDDFEGGEISFVMSPYEDVRSAPSPSLDYDIALANNEIAFGVKPKAGSIIIFPSSAPYYHTAHIVKTGFKYMVPGHWIHNDMSWNSKQETM